MTIEIKTTKKKATKKVAKKSAKKKAAKKPVDDSFNDFSDDMDKDLESLTGDQLDDEAKRAMIRARNEQASKQRRLNEIQMGTLVERDKAIDVIRSACESFVQKIDNLPDQLVNQLHKRTKKEIRDKLVKKCDNLKIDFIDIIDRGI